MIKLKHILIALLTLCATAAQGQYYSWGSDAPSLKWSEIKGENVRVIYPDTVSGVARRVLHYIDNVKEDISFGYTYPVMEIPFVLHPENFQSNALVMWMPKRIDFLTTPPASSFSMPWVKQLVAHEYRHAVQYNNLNRGVVRWLSYILGQQGAALGLMFLPICVIEGDAVKCETSMSTYGRGLQPSFSMGYRAIGREMLSRRNVDRWYSGSYQNYIPDHYELGYQIVDYSYTHYGENIWSRVADFSVRRPYYIATTSTALKKFYGTDGAKLMRASFNDLFDYWESLPQRDDSTEDVVARDEDNYTTYSHPIPYDESKVLSLKSDYNRSSRFVVVDDESGEESVVAYTGYVSSRPTLGGERVWWSEYRASKLFAERVNSQLCYMDMERGRPRVVRGARQCLFPTAVGNSESKIAYVEYDPKGLYSIVVVEAKGESVSSLKDFVEIQRTPIAQYSEVHGLAWDDVTDELYFIVTDDSGMWLGAIDKAAESGYRPLRKGAYITISNLRAGGGRLYYGSIESGYDELHYYDIAKDTEYRISESTYGSFYPSTPNSEGDIYAATYDKYGYHLVRQPQGVIEEEVTPSLTPQNIVNAPRTKWDLINLDSVRFTTADSVASHHNHKCKKYNKGIKLFNVHSWMPIAYNPYSFIDEQRLDVAAGATIISQNLLSNTEAFASYSYNREEGSIINGGLKYCGLGVDLEFDATYGGEQIIYTPIANSTLERDKYYSLTTSATLPFKFSSGRHNRTLSTWASWNYSNGVIYDLDKYVYNATTGNLTNFTTIGFTEGLHKVSFGVGFSDSVISAHRDLATPWGYSLSANYAMCPSNSDFSDLLSLYGRIVTRGLFPHNSLSLKGCYQDSFGGYTYNGINLLSFSSVSLLPRGFSSTDIRNSHYTAASIDYSFPLCYPEGGIGSIIYFKRLSMSLGADGAMFNNYNNQREYIYSYGGSLILDINPLRMPESGTTTINISLFQPSRGSLSFTFGTTIPL